MPISGCDYSYDRTQELRLEDIFALLVLLAGLVCLVILPADRLFALSAVYVTYYVASGRHVALVWVRFGDVYDLVEEICLAVLTAEVLMGCQSWRTDPYHAANVPC